MKISQYRSAEKDMKHCRIILTDDHIMVRQGVKKILNENPDLEVIGEAADGMEALELLEKERPDLAILDVQMPRMGGMAAAKKIKERWPEVKVLVLTMHRDREYLEKAREIGIEGFVLKENVDQVLLSAIEALCAGKTFISPLMKP
jgi:two-component system response regulator DegU